MLDVTLYFVLQGNTKSDIFINTAMYYNTVKIVNLPDMPEEEMYELLCEKFAEFPDVDIRIVQQDDDHVAYLSFINMHDARDALQNRRSMLLFGSECRAVPVYERSAGRQSIPKESSFGEYLEGDGEYSSYSFRKSEDRERASPGERNQSDDSPPRHAPSYRRSTGFRRRGFGSRRGFTISRGFGNLRSRGLRGRPYLLTSSRPRGSRRPYLLSLIHISEPTRPY